MTGEAVAAAFAGLDLAPPGKLGLAVSGGGDSMALLALAEEWADVRGRELACVTLDHGLRPEAAGEAAMVAERCAALGIPHETLAWEGWDGRGNLAEAAREARRALIGAWARGRGIGAVALGHTLDDQAETVLMRLARGSGVAGLAAMAPASEAEGVIWLRPLLGIRRAALREVLRGRGWGWAEDPSNEDRTRDRIKARAMLETLAPLGLTPERLALTAAHMAEARAALDDLEAGLAGDIVTLSRLGEARIEIHPLLEARRAVATQLLADALTAVGGQVHPPRLESLTALMARLAEDGAAAALHGCLIRRRGPFVHVRREPARTAPPAEFADGIVWDRRWRVFGPAAPGLTLGALGAEANAHARPPHRPAELLATTPAIRDGGRLVAAPIAGIGAGWSAECHIPDARRRRLLHGL